MIEMEKHTQSSTCCFTVQMATTSHWVSLKPGTQNWIQVSHTHSRDPSTVRKPSSAAGECVWTGCCDWKYTGTPHQELPLGCRHLGWWQLLCQIPTLLFVQLWQPHSTSGTSQRPRRFQLHWFCFTALMRQWELQFQRIHPLKQVGFYLSPSFQGASKSADCVLKATM